MYHTTGLTQEEISDLCVLVLQAAAEKAKASWPPSLGLYKSVVVTLTYLRRNRVQAEIAESFGVSQPTISRAIKAVSPLLKKILKGVVPTADELGRNRSSSWTEACSRAGPGLPHRASTPGSTKPPA